jgi:hydrogenase expression/formation protein HypC
METSAMCLAIPMQVKGIEGLTARCEARGVERTVSLFLLQDDDVVPGDMVLIHAGCAIQKVPAEEARLAWALFDEMLAADAAGRGGHVT